METWFDIYDYHVTTINVISIELHFNQKVAYYKRTLSKHNNTSLIRFPYVGISTTIM